MVAIIPISFGILAAGLLAVLAKPRLPTFSFNILKLYPTLLQDSTPAFNVGAKIQLHNANFISAAVYAFTFDMYYPDWDDKLSYVGHITDTRQKETPEAEVAANTTNGDNGPIWTLAPRADFEVVDDVMVIPTNAGSKVFSSLSWDAFRRKGVLQVPLSGVFHIKANGKLPLSMSMVCDNNLLDTFKMEFKSISCNLDFVGLGWTNLANESARLRSKLVHTVWRATDYPIPGKEVERDSVAIS